MIQNPFLGLCQRLCSFFNFWFLFSILQRRFFLVRPLPLTVVLVESGLIHSHHRENSCSLRCLFPCFLWEVVFFRQAVLRDRGEIHKLDIFKNRFLPTMVLLKTLKNRLMLLETFKIRLRLLETFKNSFCLLNIHLIGDDFFTEILSLVVTNFSPRCGTFT